ncbi:MAG: DNA alkylation repair protein [Bacteroidota bacterium]|nr:DNA alkylation repair protein [Bacteroidota bacterium]
MTVKQIISRLESLGNPKNVAGMARYGIVAKKVFGVSAPILRAVAKEIGHNHELALKLWATEIYDARILAAFIDDPKLTTEVQMERWVKDFDNWAICDGCCIHLFRKIPFAWKKAKSWSKRKEEFVKRAGFTLFATLAVHDEQADDKKFVQLLPIIKRASTDERNGVKKAVNWALRQIGKRNLVLNKAAIQTAKEIKKINSPAARWIANDALRELQSEAVQKRLKNKLD